MTVVTTAFLSRLAPVFVRYVDLKRALGRRFDNETRTLQSLDRFLGDQATLYPDLSAAAFQAWCQAQEKVASGVRRLRMRVVYNFCLYRRRTEPQCFVPDPALFPNLHQRVRPYIFSEQEVARLLQAVSKLNRVPSSPLRPEVIRLAIVLLFTTGIRRGELLRLTLGDYDRRDSTLLIRETKFYKSRLLPLNRDIADEMWIAICKLDPGGNFPSPQIPPSSGTPERADGLIPAQACKVVCGPAPTMRNLHGQAPGATNS